MQLPSEIIALIQTLMEGISLSDLRKESERLSCHYRDRSSGENLRALKTKLERLSYLAARLPSTYVVIYKVLEELTRRCGEVSALSMLDMGAGPGTALLAASQLSLPLTQATMIEQDEGFIDLGRKLTSGLDLIKRDWILQDLNQELNVSPHDLVIASYSLNELSAKERIEVVEKLWALTSQFLVIIEPGTKVAFESLKKMREDLLLMGAHLVAPCPHSNSCPLSQKDWCHFSARVDRSSLQRKTKDATLNYEDEKFSYLVFARNKTQPCQSRVLRHPFKGKGFIKLEVCSRVGIKELTITKKNKSSYLQSKKLEWGDVFDSF